MASGAYPRPWTAYGRPMRRSGSGSTHPKQHHGDALCCKMSRRAAQSRGDNLKPPLRAARPWPGRAHPHPLPATQQPTTNTLHPLQHHRLHSLDSAVQLWPFARHSIMYAKGSASNNASERPQVRSALGSLKRTWSGNQHDLGSTAQSSQPRNGFKSGAPPSSQEIFYEWSPSPSPPPTASRTGVRNSDSDKENGFVVAAEKARQSSCSIVGQVISIRTKTSPQRLCGSIDHPPKREPRQRSRLVFSIQLGIRTRSCGRRIVPVSTTPAGQPLFEHRLDGVAEQRIRTQSPLDQERLPTPKREAQRPRSLSCQLARLFRRKPKRKPGFHALRGSLGPGRQEEREQDLPVAGTAQVLGARGAAQGQPHAADEQEYILTSCMPVIDCPMRSDPNARRDTIRMAQHAFLAQVNNALEFTGLNAGFHLEIEHPALCQHCPQLDPLTSQQS
ncbi:hypothetical protein L1887_55956 [Cichorium endivia]|nr:hypothetical protein L1887_55956 [Cichorium endivia]